MLHTGTPAAAAAAATTACCFPRRGPAPDQQRQPLLLGAIADLPVHAVLASHLSNAHLENRCRQAGRQERQGQGLGQSQRQDQGRGQRQGQGQGQGLHPQPGAAAAATGTARKSMPAAGMGMASLKPTSVAGAYKHAAVVKHNTLQGRQWAGTEAS